jgi:AcrR family transcriptional regulator
MGRRTDTRERMVRSAASLLREHGVRGTSFPQVLRAADAPRGSLGHHFPGGRTEMLVDAIRWAGRGPTAAIRAAAEAGAAPEETVAGIVDFYRDALEASDYRAGCPIGAAAHDGFDEPELRAATAEVLDDWRAALSASLRGAGAGDEDARALSDLAVSALEGAILIARVDRSGRPLEHVAAQIAVAIRAALPADRPG